MESTHDVTEENMDTTVQLPDEDFDSKSYNSAKKIGGITPNGKASQPQRKASGTSYKKAPKMLEPLNDYIGAESGSSVLTSRKIGLVPGDSSTFLHSLVNQNNSMHSTKATDSRIQRFGSTSNRPLN